MLLEELRFRETVLGDRREVSLAEARRALEDAVDRTEVLLHRKDNGGIRVLDAMQLRGQTFRRVHLLGMNAGLFPRAPREDPLLGDALRRSLAERTGRPIPVKTEGYLEERLLLALLLGSAKERIDLSWQRADESGRARTPSLALREVARVAFGAPHRDPAREQHLPSHPAHWLAKLLEDTGLLAPGEEALLTALQSGDTAIAAEALAGRDELAPGLELLRSTQSWVAGDGHYDGRVGPGFLRDELSVSAFELLGRCPLRFFFRQVLKVRELDEPASLFNIDHRADGTASPRGARTRVPHLDGRGCLRRTRGSAASPRRDARR